MNLLLDTHAFLWFIEGNARLSHHAQTLIEDIDNDKQISVVSLWEIAIKVSLGRLTLSQPFYELIPQQMRLNGFELMPITVAHLDTLISLPFHHRDPFDRLLIAQAVVEGIPLVSADSLFSAYPVTQIW